MPTPPTPPKKGLLKRFRNAFADLATCEELDLKEAYRLSRAKVRIPAAGLPVQLTLGNDSRRIWLFPELPLIGDRAADGVPDYLILDPEQYFSQISGFLRLQRGDKLTLGREDATQAAVLGFYKDIARRHVSVGLTDKGLIFKRLAPEDGACLTPLLKEKKINRLWNWRHAKVERLRELLEAPIGILPPDRALELLQKVNRILEAEPHRSTDSHGRPGGLVELPDQLIPIIVGDLHTLLDHLLVILTQNQFLEALQAGTACLIILGDAVHCEIEGRLEEMDSSLLIMDFILTLKTRFPDRVFYLRGNHDSFSEEIGKNGVPQGVLWERHLQKVRGKAYRREMENFYRNIPYVALSRDFVACHAAAPVSRISRDMLIDIQQHPHLIREITQNRLHKPNRPGGYKNAHVKRLRKTLGLGPDVPLIVGHTPLSSDETFWVDPGNIPHHYILYSAADDWVGVITRVGEHMLPLKYPAEPLRELFTGTVEECRYLVKDFVKDFGTSKAPKSTRLRDSR